MSSSSMAVSKSQPQHWSHEEYELAEDQDEQSQVDHDQKKTHVTSHVYLKPAHSAQSLHKEEVLRRIRHRKRATNLTFKLKGLIRLPSSKPDWVPHKSWLDDPFATL